MVAIPRPLLRPYHTRDTTLAMRHLMVLLPADILLLDLPGLLLLDLPRNKDSDSHRLPPASAHLGTILPLDLPLPGIRNLLPSHLPVVPAAVSLDSNITNSNNSNSIKLKADILVSSISNNINNNNTMRLPDPHQEGTIVLVPTNGILRDHLHGPLPKSRIMGHNFREPITKLPNLSFSILSVLERKRPSVLV